MIFETTSIAQNKFKGCMQWRVAQLLPAIKGRFAALGVAGPVAGVHNNVLFFGGGANFPDSMPWLGGKKKYYDELYVFVKENDQIVPLQKSFQLPGNLAYAANCSTPQGVLVAGGENEQGISDKVFLLQWDEGEQTVKTNQLPKLPLALTNAAVSFYANKVYVAGGETSTVASNQLFCLDLEDTATGWQQLPAIPKAVSHAVLVVQHKGKQPKLYLLGGRKKNINGISDLYASVYEFDLHRKQWRQQKSLPYKLSAGTGIAIGTNKILLFGGDKGTTFHQAETLISAINAEKNDLEKQELLLQKNKVQSTHPGFSGEVLQYNTLYNKWTVYDRITSDAPVTTTAVQWGNQVIIPSGEIRAGVRSPAMLIGSFCEGSTKK